MEPIHAAPSRLRTIAVWGGFAGGFALCWWMPRVVDDACWVALALVAAMLARAGVAARVPRALVAVAAIGAVALVASASSHLGIATLGGSFGVGALAGGGALARHARMQRKLRAFRAAVRAGRAGERSFVDVASWQGRWFYQATGWLVQERRLGPAVRLLRGRAAGKRDAALHTLQLVHALLDLGQLDEARAAVDGVAALAPNGRELHLYLDARVRIACGDPATVAARVGLEPEEGAHPAWRAYRLLVRADAAAALGDRDESRRLLAQLPEPGRTRALTLLRSSDRPCSALAAELLDGTSAPYR